MHQAPVNNYTKTVNLVTPHGFPLRLEIVIDGYDLDDITSTGRLLIRGPGQNRGVVVDSESYTTIDALNNKYIIDVPPDAVDYSAISEGTPYTWSFDGDGDVFRLQGDFLSVRDTGQTGGTPNEITVNIGQLSIEVSFPAGPQGDKGDRGPAGPWSAEVRAVTTSGQLLADDQTVIIRAGGGTISIAAPSPADPDFFSNGTSKTINFIRPADDTGTVQLTGTGPGLPDSLEPDEAGYMQSDGTNIHIFW